MLKSFYKNNEKSINRIEGELKMLKIESNRKKAFTLAETLITVVILGIVAAILVPNLIKNQVENANRTKVKKAMASYEKAINYMIIENDIRETEALRELGQNNCQYTREYFKTVKDGSNNCIFKTADRVWWDITDITNPIISLKDEITDANEATIVANALNLNADTTSFALIGRFDEVGTLRVNDNAYEQGLENNLTNQAYMIKLWHFINNSDNFSSKEQFATCKATRANSCTISVNGKNTTYTRITTNTDTTVDTLGNGNAISCIYDRSSNQRTCNGYVSTAPAGDYWISDNLGRLTAEEAKDMTDSVCTHANCIANGDYYEAAKRKCSQSGGHLASLAELEIARANGKMTSGWFWPSEESDSYYSYVMTSNGNVRYDTKGSRDGQVICVGN